MVSLGHDELINQSVYQDLLQNKDALSELAHHCWDDDLVPNQHTAII